MKPLLLKLTLCVILLFVFFHVFSQFHITNHLQNPGRVSFNIYNAQGQVVRELKWAETQTSGTHTIIWDGKDQNGVDVPGASTCTWKLLQTQGLQASFIMPLGANFPYGPYWLESAGLGNHVGPTGVAVDSSGVYISSSGNEATVTTIKMSTDGNQRIWSNMVIDSKGDATRAMDIMDGWIYYFEGIMNVCAAPVNTPVPWYGGYGIGPGSAGNFLGIRWHCVYPGDPIDTDPDYGAGPMQYAAGGVESWRYQKADMAAYNSGNNPQLVICYKDHNSVKWFMPQTGQSIDEISIPNPVGVAIDNTGSILAISNGAVVKFSRTNRTPVILIPAASLNSPHKLAVDRQTGQILVAEHGTGQQVKRFTAAGVLLNTYGAEGGRQFGLYNPVNFMEVEDICADNNGGFYIVETNPFRRTAHFASNGSLIKEWYGGQRWAPHASPEPGNPSIVWGPSGGKGVGDGDCITRYQLDYANKNYTVHSTYKLNRPGGFGQACGIDYLKAQRHNGITYLCNENSASLWIYKVDEVNWTVKPCVRIFFGNDYGAQPNPYNYAYIWTDANNDGIEQANEKRNYPYRIFWFNLSPRTYADMSWMFCRQGDGAFFKLKIINWVNGVPVYEDLPAVFDGTPFSTLPASCLKSNGSADIGGNNNPLAPASDGSIFIGADIGEAGWAQVQDTRMVKINAQGSVQWEVGSHIPYPPYPDVPTSAPPAGKVHAFRSTIGETHGCIIANDYCGGWSGSPNAAITYVWDTDGLWVGGLFENCQQLPNIPSHVYNLSSDNGSGDLYTDPLSGDVYYYGAWENETRIYKITGWDNWVRQSGPVVGVPLPLSFIEFKGVIRNNKALLNWKVENEANTNSFDIERSIEGTVFAKIGNVPSRNQPGVNEYNFTDSSFSNYTGKKIFYRLKQFDNNGQFKFSSVVTLTQSKQEKIKLYPNPASKEVIVLLNAIGREIFNVQINDNAGKAIRTFTWTVTAGNNSRTFGVSDLPKGIYFITISSNTEIRYKLSFVKQ